MRGLENTPEPLLIVSLDEVKAYLKIEHAYEDALLAGLVRTATQMCESFTGQTLIERQVTERIWTMGQQWQRLKHTPVMAIERTAAVENEGVADFICQDRIDTDGDGWVRTNQHRKVLLDVTYRAGHAASWNKVSEPLRQGIIRLVAHMHLYRDEGGNGATPAVVAALWQPWRRMRLL